MTNWNVVLGTKVGVEALQKFADGQLSCETVQQVFRNRYPEASAELRSVIRFYGTTKARSMARKALQRRKLV